MYISCYCKKTISTEKKPEFLSRYTFTLEIPVLTGPQSIGLS